MKIAEIAILQFTGMVAASQKSVVVIISMDRPNIRATRLMILPMITR